MISLESPAAEPLASAEVAPEPNAEARAAAHAEARTAAHAEAEAFEALAKGDHVEVLRWLMARYGDDVFRLCDLVLGDSALAADVHQGVFIEAFRDLERFQRRSSLRAWLLGIARHRCLDAIRRRRRFWRRIVLRERLPEVADPRPSAEDALDAVRQQQALAEALATLKPEVRVAVLLRYQQGLSYEEMAGVCGERAPTLQARVARAMPLLRRAMERAGVTR